MHKSPASLLFLLLICLSLAACGFRLRGYDYGDGGGHSLPWKSVFLAGVPSNSGFATLLKKRLRANGVQVVKEANKAEAIFEQLGDVRTKEVLSFNTRSQVREYRLLRRYSMRVIDTQKRSLVAPNSVRLWRDINYSDDEILAKSDEEQLLWRDIRRDLVSQLLRRLTVGKKSSATNGQTKNTQQTDNKRSNEAVQEQE